MSISPRPCVLFVCSDQVPASAYGGDQKLRPQSRVDRVLAQGFHLPYGPGDLLVLCSTVARTALIIPVFPAATEAAIEVANLTTMTRVMSTCNVEAFLFSHV